MNHDREPNHHDSLPVASAQLMAWLVLAMSAGFVVILVVFFLQSVFSGTRLLVIAIGMFLLSLVSSRVALNRLMAKIPCPHCGNPFFKRALQLFQAPKRCQYCNQAPDA